MFYPRDPSLRSEPALSPPKGWQTLNEINLHKINNPLWAIIGQKNNTKRVTFFMFLPTLHNLSALKKKTAFSRSAPQRSGVGEKAGVYYLLCAIGDLLFVAQRLNRLQP
jgi:hypothetical protein